MSFYSQELVEEIRSRSDIVDVINSYVRLQRKGSNYVGVCPFHNDHSPSMSVNQHIKQDDDFLSIISVKIV